MERRFQTAAIGIENPMKCVSLVPAILAICVLSSCEIRQETNYITIEPDAIAPEPNIKLASSLKISYVIGGQPRSLTIKDPKDVRSVLDALEVKATYRGLFSSSSPVLKVDFRFPDGTAVELRFYDEIDLIRTGWGEVHVGPGFYRRISEVVSNAEGRPVDLLGECR